MDSTYSPTNWAPRAFSAGVGGFGSGGNSSAKLKIVEAPPIPTNTRVQNRQRRSPAGALARNLAARLAPNKPRRCLGILVALRGGLAKPAGRCGVVLRHPLAVPASSPEVERGARWAPRAFALLPESLGMDEIGKAAQEESYESESTPARMARWEAMLNEFRSTITASTNCDLKIADSLANTQFPSAY